MTEVIRQGDIPGVQLRRRVWLAGQTIDAVWPWLSEPRLLASWLADEVAGSLEEGLELRTEVGGSTIVEELRARVGDGQQGDALELEHRRSDWRAATRVTFALTSRPDGCELSVLQQGFQGLPLSKCLTAWESSRSHWEVALGRLALALEVD